MPRVDFNGGGAAGADDTFAKELEFYFLNPETELPKAQTYKETMNPIQLVNDIIEMIVYDTFSVNDSYTKTEADNRYPFLGNDSLIRTNGQTVSADITIGASTNGMSAGPISTTAKHTSAGTS